MQNNINKLNLIVGIKKYIHPFHLVNSSLWPVLISLSLFNFLIILVAYMNTFKFFSIIFDFVVI